MGWHCKICNSELIGIYELTSENKFWGKVDKKFNIIEFDEMEDDTINYKRIITSFTCDCKEDCSSKEMFDEKAIWKKIKL